MAHSYITEAEFYRYAPEAAPLLSSLRPLYGWTVHSGSVYKAYQTGSLAVLFRDGEDLGSAQAALVDVDTDGEWFYDSASDTLYLQSTNDPNSLDMHAGEDHSTYVGAVIQSASRLLDALIDTSHPTPIPRDRSGNYDEVVKQATAYQLGAIIAQGRDPQLADRFRERLMNADKTGIIDGINGGWIKLAGEIDADSAAGEIREMGAIAGGIHLTRTFGAWTGAAHDRLKVVISTGGGAGTARFKVYGYDPGTDTPKTRELTASGGELLKLYQRCAIGNGLYLLFEGDDGDSATVDDEWEVEVYSADQQVENSGLATLPAERY